MNMRVYIYNILLLLALTSTPLAICMDDSLNDGGSPGSAKKELDWALHNIMTREGALYQGLQEIILKIGAAFDRLWQKILGDPETDLSTIQDVTPELDEIGEGLKELAAFSSQHQQSVLAQADATKARTLEIINWHSKRALIADTAIGAAGISALYIIYQNNWPIIFARAHRRFITGLEVPTVMSIISTSGIAGKILLAPIMKPLGCLIVGSLCWYQIKKKIRRPVMLKFQSQHKQTNAKIDALQRDTRNAMAKQVESTEQRFAELEKRFQEELKMVEHRALESCLKTIEQKANSLEQAQDEQARQLRKQLLGVTAELKQQFGAMEGDVGQALQLGLEQKPVIAQAIAQQANIFEALKTMRTNEERKLAYLRSQNLALQSLPDPLMPPPQPTPPRIERKTWFGKKQTSGS